MHTVVELLAERHRTNSRPGHRTDDARLSLVIEGGSSRGAYSGGMVMAIEELGLLPCFDAVYGSSAGGLNGAWLLCGRAIAGAYGWWDPAIMQRVINPRRALTGGVIVDTEYLIRKVYEDVIPMGFDDILANAVTFHPLATDITTGESTDLNPWIVDQDSLQTALMASTSIPLLTRAPVTLGGRRFIDAGVSEGVPIRTALGQGATHVLALRTRRADEPATALGMVERLVVTSWTKKFAPGATEALLTRAALRTGEEDLLAGTSVLQIRPPLGSPGVGSTERGQVLMRKVVDIGFDAAYETLLQVTGPPAEPPIRPSARF